MPPFITSKLQQEAFKKLRFSVRKTMQVAQRLYEGVELGADGSVGLITYMRTDSTRVSDDALKAVRERVETSYGAEYLPEKPVVYKTKKDAQDAHEAIRPTYLDRDPESVKRYLSKDEYALYLLIWNRFVASQMRPAVYDETIVDIEAGAYLLRARGSTLKFRGFLAVYEETPDEKRTEKPKGEGDAASDTAPQEAATQLPPLAEGDILSLKKLDTDQHFTQPPPRFSEASLVKELEENGIGRPSTYASIIATIEAREYMEKREAKLYPTELGFLVTDLLVQHFQDIMSVEYTAAMEHELDEIEDGKDNLLNTLNQFWKKFEKDLKTASKEMENIKGKEEPTDEVCDKCGSQDGDQMGPLREVPGLLQLSRMQEHPAARRRRGSRRGSASRGRREGGLPEGRPAHGAQEGPVRSLPGLLELPRVQDHEAPRAGARAASSRWSSSRPSTRTARIVAAT